MGYAMLFFYQSLPGFSSWSSYILPWSDESQYCIDFFKSSNDSNCQEQYFSDVILKQNTDLFKGLFEANWPVVLVVLVSWAIVGYALSSTSNTGKSAYITATLPYICLTTLLITVLTKPGAIDIGIQQQYLTVNMTKVWSKETWKEAATQVFFSQGTAWGVLIAYSCHNNFRFPGYSMAWRFSAINALTSIYGGFVIFGTLGLMAYKRYCSDLLEGQNCIVSTEQFNAIVGQGPTLAFVVYPAALAAMGKVGWFMSIVFFGMIITLATGSQVGMVGCVYEAAKDKISYFRENPMKGLAIVILLHCVGGFPMFSKAGYLWLSIYDTYCCTLTLQTVAIIEMLTLCYVFGSGRFISEVELMLNHKLPIRIYWESVWKYISPALNLGLLAMGIIGLFGISEKTGLSNWMLISYDDKVRSTIPDGQLEAVNAIGWLMPISCIMVIIWGAIRKRGQTSVDNRFFDFKNKTLEDEKLIKLDCAKV